MVALNLPPHNFRNKTFLPKMCYARCGNGVGQQMHGNYFNTTKKQHMILQIHITSKQTHGWPFVVVFVIVVMIFVMLCRLRNTNTINVRFTNVCNRRACRRADG
jgi:hypothetical protein